MKKVMVLLLTMALLACGISVHAEEAESSAAEEVSVEGKVVGMIPITMANGFHQAETQWREKFAEEYGITLKILDGEFDQSTILRFPKHRLVKNLIEHLWKERNYRDFHCLETFTIAGRNTSPS